MSTIKYLRVFALTLILLVTLVGQSQAQGQPPPQPTQPPSYPPGVDELKTIGGTPPQAASDATAAAIALGAPGLSFRYVQTFGVTEQAYPADAQHLNGPSGLFMDGSDNLYVAEEVGSRMLKYRTSDGENLLSIGTVGMRYTDNYVFSWLEDIALDGSGNIWVADGSARVVQYDAAGNFLQQLPAADPWNPGNDNTHFGFATGIAFDSTGRMFVTDRGNHRIQVYDFVGGSPVYNATIGETGVPGNDNTHFNSPNHIAVDSSDRLYVADMDNNRVQRCSFAAGWTCSTFDGTGSAGSGINELNIPNGLAIDQNDNVYIADRGNSRIKKCTSAGSCSTFATEPDWDVAVDSSGNVYTSAWPDSTIRKYNSSGVFLGVFAGTSGVPYVADTARLNTPWGISVTADGSIYTTEDRGDRLVKLNAAGVQQWSIGQAGVGGSDNTHFGGAWPYLNGNPAVDAAGRIYVPDTGNNRVQIFNSNASFAATFGTAGSGNYQFNCPSGVALSPANGDIYVTDRCNNRIMVYDSSRVYKTRLGSGTYGSSNTEFASPQGVAVDKNGIIYVADTDNSRVQKCTLSGVNYTCSLFAGVTGEGGNDFGHLSGPSSVGVDSAGRVYVADKYNNRIQVFDPTGAYLTTIGNAWGANTGMLRNPSGVALDSQGNVYVTDSDNHRIQKFAPGVPGWKQANINGFGNPSDEVVKSLEVYNGQLYAGTGNYSAGGQVWRTSNGSTWTPVSQPGFGSAFNSTNALVYAMIEFMGQLYAGTGYWENDGVGGQIWRCTLCDGSDWAPVEGNGFGSADNSGFTNFGVFSNTLYAATFNSAGGGLEIWRSSTGNVGDWGRVVSGGNGNLNTYNSVSMTEFNGYLYTAVENNANGLEIWRTANGTAWDRIATGGFSAPANNQWASGLVVYGSNLYVGSGSSSGVARIYRSNNGSDWSQVGSDGFGDSNNIALASFAVLNGLLYATTNNPTTGTEIWRSTNGTTWQQVSPDGFGDSNNTHVIWNNATAVFNKSLYLGTWNTANGAEVWQILNQLYLPLLRR